MDVGNIRCFSCGIFLHHLKENPIQANDKLMCSFCAQKLLSYYERCKGKRSTNIHKALVHFNKCTRCARRDYDECKAMLTCLVEFVKSEALHPKLGVREERTLGKIKSNVSDYAD